MYTHCMFRSTEEGGKTAEAAAAAVRAVLAPYRRAHPGGTKTKKIVPL